MNSTCEHKYTAKKQFMHREQRNLNLAAYFSTGPLIIVIAHIFITCTKHNKPHRVACIRWHAHTYERQMTGGDTISNEMWRP